MSSSNSEPISYPCTFFRQPRPIAEGAAGPLMTALFTTKREGQGETAPLFTIFTLQPPGRLCTQKATAEGSYGTYKIFALSLTFRQLTISEVYKKESRQIPATNGIGHKEKNISMKLKTRRIIFSYAYFHLSCGKTS